MRSGFKRIASYLLLLAMVLTLLPGNVQAAGEIITTPSGYTSAQDVNYVTVGNYVANWGARGEDCVFLSTYAQSFYTSDYSFETLSKQEGGSSQGNAPQSELYASLKSYMTDKHTHKTSYDETKGLYKYTDCVLGDYSKLSSFYSGTMVDSAWSSGGKTWNREHTWPNSKGLGGSDENDIMMLRPTVPSENGSRGNTAYGQSSGFFDPGVSNRGDCARIALYVYVRWGNTNFMWGSGGVIENLDVLLRWMAEDPVDTWEMGRNDAVQSITGTRNVFIDYPEYAWLLFGRDVPTDVTTPSNNVGVSGNPGNGNAGNTGSNSGSNTGSNSGNTTPPADSNYEKVTTLNTGDKVVIVAPAYNMALSMVKTGYYNIGVDVSGGFGSISEDETFTVTKNTDGTYTFVSASGKALALADQYSSLNDTGANKSWELSNASNGQFYLRNTGRDLYLEWYVSKDNWSAYKPDSLTNEYELAFYKKVESTSGGSSGSSGNTGNNGNTGNTGNNGSAGSVTIPQDQKYQPVNVLNTGDKVLVVAPSGGMALSVNKAGFYNAGVDLTGGFGGITENEVFTVTKNTDGTYTFVSASGKTLALADMYSALSETGANKSWELISGTGDYCYLRNTGRDTYLRWDATMSNWSVDKPASLSGEYGIAFYKDMEAPSGGNTDVTEPSQPAPTQPETQAPTDPTEPSQSAPTEPDSGAEGEKKNTGWIWIVAAAVLVVAVAGGVCFYIFVIRPKQGAAIPTEDVIPAPVEEAEETPEESEAPTGENPEEN